MVKRHRRGREGPITFGDACELLSGVLNGPARRDIIDALCDPADFDASFSGLRQGMRTHVFEHGGERTSLRRVVDTLDARTRREGLHVIHGWDFAAQRRPADIAPVLLLDYCLRLGVPAVRARHVLSVLLDQYFLALLSLLTMRAWDDGDPNTNLDLVSGLISELQGPDGSGCQTVDDAESLILLAVAYYHPEEPAYDHLLDRIRVLNATHALRLALPCASVFGSHLRWGLRFMYKNDVGVMRDDNVVDYPWILFSLSTLMRAYAGFSASGVHSGERVRIVGALLDALSADPWAFDGVVPPCLAEHAAEHAALCEQIDRYRGELLREFSAHRPSDLTYSPLGFGCNFLSNAVVALVATMIDNAGTAPSLNALFTRASGAAVPKAQFEDQADGPAEQLVARLMGYAAGDPARLAKGGAPLIVYDPRDAAHYFNTVVRTLKRVSPAS